jgi:hypothetical protein
MGDSVRPKKAKGLQARRSTAEGVPARVPTVEKERANTQHWILEKAVVDLCSASGIAPLTNRHMDVLANSGNVSIIFEMKSCYPLDMARSLRHAVWQLLEYRYLYRNALNPEVRLCAVVERRPTGTYQWMIGFLEHLGVGIIWGNGGGSQLNCNDFTKQLLGDILPQIKDWGTAPKL